jgi:hypothetical protein
MCSIPMESGAGTTKPDIIFCTKNCRCHVIFVTPIVCFLHVYSTCLYVSFIICITYADSLYCSLVLKLKFHKMNVTIVSNVKRSCMTRLLRYFWVPSFDDVLRARLLITTRVHVLIRPSFLADAPMLYSSNNGTVQLPVATWVSLRVSMSSRMMKRSEFSRCV